MLEKWLVSVHTYPTLWKSAAWMDFLEYPLQRKWFDDRNASKHDKTNPKSLTVTLLSWRETDVLDEEPVHVVRVVGGLVDSGETCSSKDACVESVGI